jgi:hypothetical protein
MAGALICSECDAPITKQSKSGRCRKCAFARMMEAYRGEKRSQAMLNRLTDPYQRSRLVRQITQAGAEARKDPRHLARLAELGRANIKAAFTPKARANWRAARARANFKRTETMLAWCPPRLRDQYRKLLKRGDMRAAKARAIIEPQITPFDRQLMKVRAGAGISMKVAAPSRSYDYTLGGVTGALT